MYLYAEILEALNSSPVPAMATEFQISTSSATDTQQFNTSTTVPYKSNVSSVKHTTASVNSITQLPPSEYLYSGYTYIIMI